MHALKLYTKLLFISSNLVNLISASPFPIPEGQNNSPSAGKSGAQNRISTIFFRTSSGRTGSTKNRDFGNSTPEPEPETDQDRRKFQLCLMENCKRGRRNCRMVRWRLRESWNCDNCAKKNCGMGELENRNNWADYNRFVGR